MVISQRLGTVYDKSQKKSSPTCQLLILKKKCRKKMKRDLHMMQLHKQLQATFNFLGKAVCFFKSAHIRCRVKNACYLLFNILQPYLSRKHRHKYSYLTRGYLSVGLDMTISVSVNNIHLLRMFLGGDEAAARSLPGICGSWTFQRDRPPPSSSHPRPLSWTTSSPLLLLLLLQVQALRKFSPSVISHQFSAIFSLTLDFFPL